MRRTIISVSLLAGLALVAAAATRASDIRVVQIADRCDSITFPPEAGCQGRGGVTFQKFLEKVNAKDGGHGAWRFHMDGGDLRMGEPLRITNTGGEPHSFTEVSSFGTGVVLPLNEALPTETPPAVPVGFPSLGAATGATTLLPGQERRVNGLTPGTHYFQCLIHPWMRVDVQVR